MADIMSAVCAIPTIGPLGGSIVISALCCRFSTASITLVSKRSPSILRILLRPVSTSLRMVGVIWYFLAVYSTFIALSKKSEVGSQIEEVKTSRDHWVLLLQSDFRLLTSLFHSSLMRARDLHIFPILRDGSASNLDALRSEEHTSELQSLRHL